MNRCSSSPGHKGEREHRGLVVRFEDSQQGSSDVEEVCKMRMRMSLGCVVRGVERSMGRLDG